MSTSRPVAHYDDSMQWFEVVTTRAPQVLEHVPGSAVVGSTDEGPVVRVPWDQHSAEVLANLRAPHLPPILRDYHWPGLYTPMPHQYTTAGAMSTHRKFFCLDGMGTGKTLSALWACDYLVSIGAVRQVLIICPKSIVRNAWGDTIKAHFPHLSVSVLVDTNPLVRRRKATSEAVFHIVNPSGVEVCFDEMIARKYDLVIIDEATLYKKHNTRRWKFARPIVAAADRCWMLTGTPATQYPVDAHGQIKLMYQEAWNVTETAFKTSTMTQCSKYRWVPKPDAARTIYDAMQPASRVDKKDVLKDMPPITTSTRTVELSPDQKKYMAELRKAAATQIAGAEISAVHAAALRIKLLQIASGSVYDDDSNPIDIDCPDRMNEMADLVAQVRAQDDGTGPPAHKVIVVCAFTHTVDRVHAMLQKAGFNFGKLYGDVPLGQRERILTSMETTREFDGIVAHPECLSHGVTLISCTTTVFFTPCEKAEVALQVSNRMDRPGQKHPMQVIYLTGCPAEDTLYERMTQRFEFNSEVLEQYDDFVHAL